MRLGYVIAPLFVLLLGACGTPSPTKTVFQLEAGETALVQAAATYSQLPRCVDNGPKACSDQGVVDQMRKAVTAADAAIDAAETTVRNTPTVDATFALSAAQNAVQALTAILNAYSVKVN